MAEVLTETPTHISTELMLPSRRDVLLRAAELIEERGWTLGVRGMPYHADCDGPLCMEGAVAEAVYQLDFPVFYGPDGPRIPREMARIWGYKTAEQVLPPPPGKYRYWHTWNDQLGGSLIGNSRRKVVAALRRAAKAF